MLKRDLNLIREEGDKGVSDLKENVNESLHVLLTLSIARSFSAGEILVLQTGLL